VGRSNGFWLMRHCMDLTAILQGLYAEKAKIEVAIAELERIAAKLEADNKPPQAKRRGRTFMGPEERQQVAARMKSYWDKQRGNKQP
jgi:hypothetical protein